MRTDYDSELDICEDNVSKYPIKFDQSIFGGAMLGEIGFRAYGDSVKWKNYLGHPMPRWRNLPENIRIAWDSAAYAVVNASTRVYEKGMAGCVCDHPATMHDVAEISGEKPMCCVDGCGCGAVG